MGPLTALKVLIIPDKFKGTLPARAAAEAIARGWRRARPQDRLELVPMSDGGDGFGDVLSAVMEARLRTASVIDAAHRPCRAKWWWESRTQTAIIESATVIGLAMLPRGKFHPYKLDTFGLGLFMRHVARTGARSCLVGLGGSATNDGGFGLARALGWEFLGRDGQAIEQWTRLDELRSIRRPTRRFGFKDLIVAVDVRNPLLGPSGATRVYGPQKGLKQFALAERCLRRLARVTAIEFGSDFADIPGAGAAGGLGFGLMAFTGGRLEPGFDLFARLARLQHRIRTADVVVTGEGQLDGSSFMGKGTGEIARLARLLGKPCLALAGTMEPRAAINRKFAGTWTLEGIADARQARARAAFWLEKLAAKVAAAAGQFCRLDAQG